MRIWNLFSFNKLSYKLMCPKIWRGGLWYFAAGKIKILPFPNSEYQAEVRTAKKKLKRETSKNGDFERRVLQLEKENEALKVSCSLPHFNMVHNFAYGQIMGLKALDIIFYFWQMQLEACINPWFLN